MFQIEYRRVQTKNTFEGLPVGIPCDSQCLLLPIYLSVRIPFSQFTKKKSVIHSGLQT